MKTMFAFAAFTLLHPLAANAIFYGDDDYIEVDQIPKDTSSVDWRATAASVAIMVRLPESGDVDLSNVKPMRDRFGDSPLKTEYKYAQQPQLAMQTAFLVAEDKIMTAGHAGIERLENSAFIFDYIWDSKSKRLRKVQYGQAEIYRCKKILLQRHDEKVDYAICQLDKPVTGRRPLTLKAIANAAVIDKHDAKMISAPDGTPLKLTNAGQLLAERPSKRSPDLKSTSYFFHTLDNSGGSSGAPIFLAETGQVIGIQSGGDDNFTRKNGITYATRGDLSKSNLGRPKGGMGKPYSK